MNITVLTFIFRQTDCFCMHPTGGIRKIPWPFLRSTKSLVSLALIGHQSTLGDHPRNFAIDPAGNFLIVANQVTNNIVVFRRNKQTGLLTKIRQEIKVPSPSCVQIRTYGN